MDVLISLKNVCQIYGISECDLCLASMLSYIRMGLTFVALVILKIRLNFKIVTVNTFYTKNSYTSYLASFSKMIHWLSTQNSVLHTHTHTYSGWTSTNPLIASYFAPVNRVHRLWPGKIVLPFGVSCDYQLFKLVIAISFH